MFFQHTLLFNLLSTKTNNTTFSLKNAFVFYWFVTSVLGCISLSILVFCLGLLGQFTYIHLMSWSDSINRNLYHIAVFFAESPQDSCLVRKLPTIFQNLCNYHYEPWFTLSPRKKVYLTYIWQKHYTKCILCVGVCVCVFGHFLFSFFFFAALWPIFSIFFFLTTKKKQNIGLGA